MFKKPAAAPSISENPDRPLPMPIFLYGQKLSWLMGMKEFAITFGIAVLFTALVMVSIDSFYERPQYEDYCNSSHWTKPYIQPREVASNCTPDPKEDGCYRQGGTPIYEYDEAGCSFVESCDLCNKDYEAANKEYTNVVFIITAIFGIAAIFFGVYYKTEFIGVGFMFSGIILMFIGTMQNFDSLNRFLKPVVLLVELLLVLFIAYKKILNRDKTPIDEKPVLKKEKK
jgi:hypothetical protein